MTNDPQPLVERLVSFFRLPAELSPAKTPFFTLLVRLTSAFTVVAGISDIARGFPEVGAVELGCGAIIALSAIFRRGPQHLAANVQLCGVAVWMTFVAYALTQIQDRISATWAPLFPFLLIFICGARLGIAWVALWGVIVMARQVLFELGVVTIGLPFSEFAQVALSCTAMTFCSYWYERLHRYDELRLDVASRVDALTGTFNRKALHQFLSLEIDRATKARTGHSFSLLIFDLDHFKRVNDTYGHNVGDAVLREFTRVVQLHKGEDDVLGRLGGEEFCLLAPAQNLGEAERLAERLRHAIALNMFPEVGRVTSSIGVAEFDGGTAKALMARADQALYAAKMAGRNRVEAHRGTERSTNEFQRRQWRDSSQPANRPS